MSFGNLAKMAQQMQAEMARVQAELESLQVEGSAGGGAVKAVVTGKLDLVSVTIDPASGSRSIRPNPLSSAWPATRALTSSWWLMILAS